jgi:hypothetical protein
MFGLIPCDLQYKIKHHSPDCFKEDETVFLVSNPEHPMRVLCTTDNEVFVISDEGLYPCVHATIFPLPPECLLQYKYAGIKVYKKKYDICLN